MLITIPLRPAQCDEEYRFGAVRGKADMALHRKKIFEASSGDIVVFDFSGIQGVNVSYLRNTCFWFLSCLHGAVPEQLGSTDFTEVQPTSASGMAITGLSSEVREDIDTFCFRFRICLFEVLEMNETDIKRASILGHLDDQKLFCLQSLEKLGGSASAGQLLEASKNSRVQLTAWNNRLAGLQALRLVTRKKEGMTWIYSTIAEKVECHGIPETA